MEYFWIMQVIIRIVIREIEAHEKWRKRCDGPWGRGH